MPRDLDRDDQRDAARLTLLCIDIALRGATDTASYRLPSSDLPLDRDAAIEYLARQPKPIRVTANMADQDVIALAAQSAVLPTQRYRGERPMLVDNMAEDELVIVRGGKAEFTMRASAVAVWERSYQLDVSYLIAFGRPDDAAAALGATGVLEIAGEGTHISRVHLRGGES